MRVPLFLEARHGSQKIKAVRKVASIKSSPIRRTSLHRNSRRKPPNSFGWRNAALIHTRKRPCARDAHFATLC